jgi:hypothetical protein
MKASVAPAKKDASGYISTHVVNMVDTLASEEETSPLNHRRKRANKVPLCDASSEPPRVADAPLIEGLVLSLFAYLLLMLE